MLCQLVCKLMRWARRHAVSDTEVDAKIVPLVHAVQLKYKEMHKLVQSVSNPDTPKPLRSLKLFLLSDWAQSIKEIGSWRTSDTAPLEAKHSALKRENKHMNNHHKNNESSHQIAVSSIALAMANATLEGGKGQRESQQMAAIRTQRIHFPKRPMGTAMLHELEPAGRSNRIKHGSLDRLASLLPGDARTEFTLEMITSTLGIPAHAQLTEICLKVTLHREAYHPVRRGPEEPVRCCNIRPLDEKYWGRAGVALQLVPDVRNINAREFCRALCFFEVDGRYTYQLSDTVVEKAIKQSLVLVRMFHEVTQTDLPGMKMFQYRTGNKRYETRNVDEILTPSFLQLHPGDKNKATGVDGGATSRRFFYVPGEDLAYRV